MASDVEKMMEEFRREGFEYADPDAIFRQKELKPEAIALILKWIPAMYADHFATADLLVRALIAAKEPFDPTLLIDIFEHSDLNFSLKSGIAYTLAFAKTSDISEWLKDQLLEEDYSIERSALVSGLYEKGGFADTRAFMDFLKKIFYKYHDEVVLKLFKKFGDQTDLLFLEEQAREADKKLANAIHKIADAMVKKNKKSKDV